MKAKEFHSKQQAQAFAQDVRGFVEGPFINEHLENQYIVFYKGGSNYGRVRKA